MNIYTYEVDHGDKSPRIRANMKLNGGKVTAVCFDAALPKLEKAEAEIQRLQAECERLKEHYGYLISAAQIAVQLRCKDIKDCFTTKAVTSPVAMDALKNALKQLQEVDSV